MSPGDLDPVTSDCIHDKVYGATKYTCGQHPACAHRFDEKPEKRSEMVEFTKLRMLNDYGVTN